MSDVEYKRETIRKHFDSDESGWGEIARDVIAGYDAEIATLAAAKEYAEERLEVAIRWEHEQAERFRQEKADMSRRHEEEKRALVERIRFAGIVFNRILEAERNGKKTARISDLLAGEPAGDVAA